MAKSYRVKWSASAEKDLEGIIDRIAIDSVAEAIRILDKLRATTEALSEMPRRGRVVPELKDQGIVSYLELQSPPWRIIYRINGDEVRIHAVFDSRRNIEDILLDRFTRA